MDKVQNSLSLDPRRSQADIEACIAFLVSFLPPEFQGAAHSWQISSSCAVKGIDGYPLSLETPPATLGAHVRFWLSDFMDEYGRRGLLQRICAYAKAQMTGNGIKLGEAIPGDPATATFNQAVFVRELRGRCN